MKPVGLVALDLDGVLLEGDSSWGIYHTLLGTLGGERDSNMEDFYSGVTDYRTWAMRDTALWRGKSIEPVHEYLPTMTLTEGAKDLVEGLRSLEVLPVIISTGISEIARRAGEILGIDLVVSNEVEVVDGKITGRVEVECGFDEKGSVLRRLAGELSIPMDRCAAIGDAENDLSMFRAVPLSLAFNPRSKEVAQAATMIIRGPSLHGARSILMDHFRRYTRS